VIAAFTLLYALSETVTAPYMPVETPEPVVTETPEPDEDPEPPDEPEDEPEEDPPEVITYTPPADEFITIYMEDSDIHSGSLLLVNHDHSFSIPEDLDLVNINEAKTIQFRVQYESAQLARSIMAPLDEMMDSFINATNIRYVTIRSAFRNYANQERILNNYISRMGRREALRWAALPGHSEHHTGLAFDFGIISGGMVAAFNGTGNTSWFRRNSHEYGFILRYLQGKTQITQTSHEPWHFRYVGLPHSTIMFENNWCLEEYIEMLRDYTFEEPFEAELNDILYAIYFVPGTEVKIPLNSEFELSGNNIDGFIVTAIQLEHDPDEINDVSI